MEIAAGRVLLSPATTRVAPPQAACAYFRRVSKPRFSPLFLQGASQPQPKLKLTLLGLQRPGSRKHQPIRVKSSDTEGNSNPNPNVDLAFLDEQSLQKDLEAAIIEEDYTRAAKIRDHLRLLQEDSIASVLSANARFYNAFRNGDLAAMHSIWAKGDHVYVVHPAAGRIDGYEMVTGSWEFVLNSDYEFPLHIDLKNVDAYVRGNLGYVTCMEVVKTGGSSWGRQVATNVFERIDGLWYMCIHHASHVDEYGEK